MKTKKLTPVRIRRLQAQGYSSQSNKQLSEMAFGIRFPYRLCFIIIGIGMITESIAVFAFMLIISFLGVALPNHPFDYLYNHIISKWMGKPAIPHRSLQLRFACKIATLWLGAIFELMLVGSTTPAMILAGMLAAVAALPSTIDLCIPSLIYNSIFAKKDYSLSESHKS